MTPHNRSSFPRPVPAAVLALSLGVLTPLGPALPGSGGPAPLQGVPPGPQARPAPDRWTVPSGTRLVVTLRDTLSTRHSREGDAFVASVVRSVQVPEGTAVPRGSALYLTAVRLAPSGTAWEPTVVRVRFDSLEVRGVVRPVQASLVRASSTKSSRIGTLLSVLLMAAAAALGGLAGRWLMGGRGALTGAALAAIAAAAYLMMFQEVDAVIPAGSEMEVRLDRTVEVPAPDATGS